MRPGAREVATPERPLAISEAIYRTLREQIVTLVRPPGTQLSDKNICAEFGVSRTPVREAILKLAEEELVVVRPKSGTSVARIRPAMLDNAQFLRKAVECAGMCDLRRVRLADRHELHRILSEQEREVDASEPGRFYALDDLFHRHLLSITGHAEAWAAVHRTKAQLDRVRYLAVSNRERKLRVLDQHRRIAEAVEDEDPQRAREALAQHLTDSFRAIEEAAKVFHAYFENS
ncbi:GntR family transcriptional regulator [Roseitranquillus sediminis]|uniref:GntR family transcriptional regulator n=1 Tax=Roseitranquillus sediminis TaxID=2809051 RepID=UPI001D0C5D4D|nr:GntR family transcriptional regulator [Roseitranquillus sediminis]MBM9593481.1 GntR family transcriptional regulator [Roseitranquillus sediminis]